MKYENRFHIIMFTNRCDNSDRCIELLQKLLEYIFTDLEVYCIALHSRMDGDFEEKRILFKNATRGIIVSAYMCGEGFDEPLLDCTIYAECMTAEIRVYQASLRSSRLNINKPLKLPIHFIPYHNEKTFERLNI